jgi:hypothetical protein
MYNYYLNINEFPQSIVSSNADEMQCSKLFSICQTVILCPDFEDLVEKMKYITDKYP